MKPTLFNLELNTREKDGQTIAELDIDGIIGFDWWSMEEEQNTKEQIRTQLRQVQEIQADKIVVNISSLGGDVDHGLAIHDLLASNDAEVETRVIGMTASAATIIAQAGDTRSMSDNALYLVHRAWTIGMGNANDFEALAKDLNKLDDRISNIYAKRSGFDQDDFLSLMNEANGDGIWISAEEAEDYGLIDVISEPMKAAALDVSIFDKYEIPKPPQAKEEETETGNVLTYKVNIDLHINSESVTKEEFETYAKTPIEKRAFTGDDPSVVLTEEEKEAESNVSAASRERAKLELLKLKHKNNG